MGLKKKFDLKYLRFHKDDIILVSMPTKIQNPYDYANADGRLGNCQVQKDKVYEFAVLNKDETRFVLLREFEQKIICEVKDFVPTNSTGEFYFIKPTFVAGAKTFIELILHTASSLLMLSITKTKTTVNNNYQTTLSFLFLLQGWVWYNLDYAKFVAENLQKKAKIMLDKK